RPAAGGVRAPGRARRCHRSRRVRRGSSVARRRGAGLLGPVAVSTIDMRLAGLGLVLPGPYPPHDPLDAVVVYGGRARTSGQLPRGLDGRLVHPGVVGASVDVEQGAEAARWCALNALSVLKAELGSLTRIEHVLT